MNSTAVTKPARSNEPKIDTWPRSEKSGTAMMSSGIAGTLRFQPFGFTLPSPSTVGPTFATVSTTTATSVVTRIEIRIAPLTCRT